MRKKCTAAVSVAALALVMTACNDTEPQGAPTAPASESSGSSGIGAGSGGAADEAAAEGFDDVLGDGEAATATHKDDDGDTKLSIKPEKTVKGSWADFKGFDLGTMETKGTTPYYVTMAYTSKGGAEPYIPSWDGELDGKISATRPARLVTIADDFPKCPGVDKSVPSGEFKVGTTDRPCNVFVVPEGEPLYMQWGADAEGMQKPLVWKVAG